MQATHCTAKGPRTWTIALTCVLLVGITEVVRSSEGGEQPPSLNALLDEADQLRLQGKWDEAIDKLQNVVDRRAEDDALAATAQIRIGMYYLNSERPTQAKNAFQEAIIAFPSQDEAQFEGRLHSIDALHDLGQYDDAMIAAQALLSTPDLTANETMWARVKRAEIRLSNWERSDVMDDLTDALATIPGPTAEPHNWARLRLAEIYAHDAKYPEAESACEAVLSDHAGGQATDPQAAWALIWKARWRLHSDKLPALTEAPDPAKMAAALALNTGHPDLAYEAHYLLGNIYARLSAQTDQLVKEDAFAGSPVASLVDETKLAQNYVNEGEWGPLMVEAMNHFGTAMNVAVQHGLLGEKEDVARWQYGVHMRHLGMGDRAVAVLRMGIDDPSMMTKAEARLAQTVGEFLDGDQSEAWRVYLIYPTSNPDPTATIVTAEFGEAAPGPSDPFVGRPAVRHCWLADLYLQEGRLEEALQAYQHAEGIAASVQERAQARNGQLRALRQMALRASKASASSLARSYRAQAQIIADTVRLDWLEIALTGPEGSAHHATERAVHSYGMWQMNYDALLAAEEFLQQLESANAAPSKIAFARYVNMQTLAWIGRYDEAILLSEQIDVELQETTNPVLEEIRVAALLRAAGYHARIGQTDSGHTLLNSILADHPEGVFDQAVARSRQHVIRYENRLAP